MDVGVRLLEASGSKVVSEMIGLETEEPVVMVELETLGVKVVSVMVGLVTEVMIVVLELEAPGSKVVSDSMVGSLVMTAVEGFKVVSATVTDKVTGAVVSGVSEVIMSVCWLLLSLVVGPSSKVVSLTPLKLVVLVNFVDLSGSKMDMVVVDSEVETFTELWVEEASVEDSINVELGSEVISVEDAIVVSNDKLVV